MSEVVSHKLHKRMKSDLMRMRLIRQSPQQTSVIYDNKNYISFSNNDYLGLANHPEVVKALRESASEYGVGNGASALLSGYHKQHAQLEEAIADFLGRERALLFSTGYMANIAVQSALLGRHDTVIHDRLNHASLIDGARLSGAQLRRYRHNDMDHLHQILAKTQTDDHRFVVTEGVFSMDGDIAPLPEVARLCDIHRCSLLVDDAHGFGVLGHRGRGTLEHFGLTEQQVPMLMVSFGKALGTFGACVAGSAAMVESLIQFGRTYVYTTAMPAPMAAASYCSLSLLQKEGWRSQRLRGLIGYFRQCAKNLGLPFEESHSAIQPLILKTTQRAEAIRDHLLRAGYLVALLRPPTVPEGTSRLRFSLSAEHREEHIKDMLTELALAMANN
ncbi:MAG: 8-amino-7-oxononanoate synthase [Gammaproteobacteria bacterium]